MMLEILIPLLTFALGSAFTLLTETLQFRRQVQREREARENERAEEHARRRAEFQRETLLGLQDTLSPLLGLTQTTMMGGTLTEEELRKRSELSLRTQVLTMRVADDELRLQVKRVQDLLIELGNASDAAVARKLWDEAALGFLEANAHLGAVLRALY
ncbi:hypothetical protein P2318_24910 [Myxococcaceae bacterium GXIMD 01537]